MNTIKSPSPSIEKKTLRIAVVDSSQAQPLVVKQLFAATSWCRCSLIDPGDLSRASGDSFDFLVWVDAGKQNETEHFKKLSEFKPKLLIVITDRLLQAQDFEFEQLQMPTNCSIEMLHGAMVGFMAAQPALDRANTEQLHMRRVSENAQKHVNAIDAELRLASRLQMDFLPRGDLRFGPAQFTTMYRPCSWVSGDIFDIFRLNEEHIGFYLADAMGHGVAAGLLTIYFKNAIDAQRFAGGGNPGMEPGKALATLNDRLVGEALNDARFVTCWFGLLHTRTLELKYAVAGHPPAICVSRDGAIKELYGEGGLLGLESGHAFAERSVQLSAGDRIVVYSDGLDGVLIADRRPLPQAPDWMEGIPKLLMEGTPEVLAGMEQRLDRLPGSLNKADDVSVVVLDIGR